MHPPMAPRIASSSPPRTAPRPRASGCQEAAPRPGPRFANGKNTTTALAMLGFCSGGLEGAQSFPFTYRPTLCNGIVHPLFNGIHGFVLGCPKFPIYPSSTLLYSNSLFLFWWSGGRKVSHLPNSWFLFWQFGGGGQFHIYPSSTLLCWISLFLFWWSGGREVSHVLSSTLFNGLCSVCSGDLEKAKSFPWVSPIEEKRSRAPAIQTINSATVGGMCLIASFAEKRAMEESECGHRVGRRTLRLGRQEMPPKPPWWLRCPIWKSLSRRSMGHTSEEKQKMTDCNMGKATNTHGR